MKKKYFILSQQDSSIPRVQTLDEGRDNWLAHCQRDWNEIRPFKWESIVMRYTESLVGTEFLESLASAAEYKQH